MYRHVKGVSIKQEVMSHTWHLFSPMTWHVHLYCYTHSLWHPMNEWINILTYFYGHDYMTSLNQPSLWGQFNWDKRLGTGSTDTGASVKYFHYLFCTWSPCPGMLVTPAARRFTSSCPSRIPAASPWSIEPAGPASSAGCNLIRPSIHLFAGVFGFCRCSTRESPPSFFSGCSGADSMRKSPLIYTQQLQRRETLLIGCCDVAIAPAHFTCHGTRSIKTCSKVGALENRKTEGGISITRCVGVSVPGQYFTQEPWI